MFMLLAIYRHTAGLQWKIFIKKKINMKIITNEGLLNLKDILKCTSSSNSLDLELLLNFSSEEDCENAQFVLLNSKIPFRIGLNHSIEVHQKNLVNFLSENFFKETSVWITPNSKVAVLTSEMSHQHLSNVIGLYEIFETLGRLSKSQSNEYLEKIQKIIMPEIVRRFNSELLPYQPHYQWEKDLVKQMEIKFPQV
jgi:hypothetical protein